MEILVFDTGPLSHFAKQNWLGVLKAVVGDRQALIPDVVVQELTEGARRDGRLQEVLDADWIEHRELTTDEEVTEFLRFASLLVKGARTGGRLESSPSLLSSAESRSSMTEPPARQPTTTELPSDPPSPCCARQSDPSYSRSSSSALLLMTCSQRTTASHSAPAASTDGPTTKVSSDRPSSSFTVAPRPAGSGPTR